MKLAQLLYSMTFYAGGDSSGCCGCHIRTTVAIGYMFYMFYGIFVTSFVFTNTAYPPYYYVDYIFGISGAVLIGLAPIGLIIANLREMQPLRFICGSIVGLDILTLSSGAFYYTIERWNDIITTALTRALRKPMERDYPDNLWSTLSVIACLLTPILLIFVIYILVYMCRPWRSYLFSAYSQDRYYDYTPQPIIMPQMPTIQDHPYSYPVKNK